MTDPHLIGPPPVSTPTELRLRRRGARELPDDLLKAASVRLGIMSLLAAALWVVAVAFGHIAAHAIYPDSSRSITFHITDGIAPASVIVSLALFAYTRRSKRSPKHILDLGLWYMVITSLAIAVMFHLGGIPSGNMVFPEISWVGVVILITAAIVPSTPRKMLIVGLVAASMNPVSMLIAKAQGIWDFGSWTSVLVMHYPDYILVGATEDETLYLVMEFLEGMDLETLVRETGPVPSARVIHILRQVCDSLEEAHTLGLVHRDIKPANIHLGRVGLVDDFVKVMDFGLVKEVSSASSEHSLATIPGQMALGTPAYMAPEMALGEPVDGRADIYALGCVAYYLLTGNLVFEAEKTFQIIAKHLQSQPIPPSQRTDRAVSPELERLVLKCLAKRADDRPQSAARLADALSWIPTEGWTQSQANEWWDNRESKRTPVQVSGTVEPYPFLVTNSRNAEV